MHLFERVVDRHGRSGSIRVGGHDPNHTTPVRIQTRRNDTQNDILAGEDTRNLWVTTLSRDCRLHDADRGRTVFLHELSDLLNSGLRPHGRGLSVQVHNGRQVGQGRLLPEGLDVGEHGRRLRVGAETIAELRLDSGEGAVELLRGGGAAFDLVKSFVEDLGDIEQADDIAFLVADGLRRAIVNTCALEPRMYAHKMPEVPRHHQLKRLGSTRGVASDHRVAGHDCADLGDMGIQSFSSNLFHFSASDKDAYRQTIDAPCTPDPWR